MKKRNSTKFVMIFIVFITFYITVFITSCSSAPKEEENVVDTKNQAAEYAEFGNKYYEEAKYDQALKFFNLALEFNISVDNETGMIQSYNSLGKVYMAQEDDSSAEQNFITAFTIAAKTNEPSLLLECNNNLGEIYLYKGDYDMALDFFDKALTLIGEKAQNDPKTAILYHNSGTVQKKLENYDKAIEYLEKALQINSDNSKYNEMAANYYMLASVFSKKEEYEEAIRYALLALENDKLIENSSGIAEDMLALGIINQKAGNLSESYDYYKKSFMIYETLNLTLELKKLLKYLEINANLLGLEDEALVYNNAAAKLE